MGRVLLLEIGNRGAYLMAFWLEPLFEQRLYAIRRLRYTRSDGCYSRPAGMLLGE